VAFICALAIFRWTPLDSFSLLASHHPFVHHLSSIPPSSDFHWHLGPKGLDVRASTDKATAAETSHSPRFRVALLLRLVWLQQIQCCLRCVGWIDWHSDVVVGTAQQEWRTVTQGRDASSEPQRRVRRQLGHKPTTKSSSHGTAHLNPSIAAPL